MKWALRIIWVDRSLRSTACDQRAAIALHAHISYGTCVCLDHFSNFSGAELTVQYTDISCTITFFHLNGYVRPSNKLQNSKNNEMMLTVLSGDCDEVTVALDFYGGLEYVVHHNRTIHRMC